MTAWFNFSFSISDLAVYCKALILTFSPREKEPLSHAMTNTSLVSHSLPLGETHAQAAVRAEVWVWERIEVRAVLQHVLSI